MGALKINKNVQQLAKNILGIDTLPRFFLV